MFDDPIARIFKARLPSHGFATDDLGYGVRFLEKALLIERAIIQYNWRHSIGWLAYDVDSETARFDWSDRSAPPPNLVVLNPANGHAHYLYGLESPVHNYTEARIRPLRYLAAVDVAMTEELGGDPGYTKLLCKNPLNEKWIVIVPRERLWTLEELASWVDMERYRDRRRRLPAVGYGRNCTLFETLRLWAYRERRRGPYLSEEMFGAAVLNHGLSINGNFDPPLPHAEVRATARSVGRWTWRRMSDEGFRKWQSANGKRSGEARREKALELRGRILSLAAEYPDLVQADYAAMVGASQQTVSRHLRNYASVISDKALPRVYSRTISDKALFSEAPAEGDGEGSCSI